ncbi:hypothetical protein [Spartinivicinus poritis]|uniref:Uncharacterized protein n=1 Tax=Spartinivicinus poritis TaxID=2994640 RepID=A0ABT5U8M2_9GAMM|nr:hypothetical protein [Spartinivicinus sp. A2-2]MDE1462724.1 hypothetical protein [Spartinivicinus sp. A2-2]
MDKTKIPEGEDQGDSEVQRELHELLFAIYNTLKSANSLMEKSGSHYHYNLDRVEIELPIRMEYGPPEKPKAKLDSSAGDSDGDGILEPRHGLKVKLPGKKDVSEKMNDDMLIEKKLNSEFGRLKVLFSRDRVLMSE